MDAHPRAGFAAELARRRAGARLSLAEVAAAAHVARGAGTCTTSSTGTAGPPLQWLVPWTPPSARAER